MRSTSSSLLCLKTSELMPVVWTQGSLQPAFTSAKVCGLKQGCPFPRCYTAWFMEPRQTKVPAQRLEVPEVLFHTGTASPWHDMLSAHMSQEVRLMGHAHPYLCQARVLVNILALLHTGGQLLQDSPAACQSSSQSGKLPPTWSRQKNTKTRLAAH